MIERNDPCWCGSQKKWKKCHYPQVAPNALKAHYRQKYGILLKSEEEIIGIRKACSFAAWVLKKTCEKAAIGVTTKELSDFADKLHREQGAIPAALGYGSPPFPAGICTSLNDIVCHGIPNDNPLIEGDIVNIDVTSIVDGFFGDTSAMVIIGKTDPERQKVVNVAKECMLRGIAVCKPGVPIWKIGEVIEDYATSQGCSVVDQFVSHGVGCYFHEPPQVPHHYNNIQIPLAAGMTFTIEPMINAGRRECVIDPDNQWEAHTIDGKPTAQWEHTILITANGHEILTL